MPTAAPLPMTASPTGRQFELVHGDQLAVVTESGATLRSYEVAGRPVVDGFAADDYPAGARGQILAPWPNRVADGAYVFGGRRHQLDLSEVDTRTAIHGLVRWATWTLEDHSPDTVALATTIWPRAGYPFLVRLRISYRLDRAGLTVRLLARNDGDCPAPYGVGFHPYLTVGTDTVDDIVLTVPADTRCAIDSRKLPTAPGPVDGTAFDFRAPKPVGSLAFDTAYGGLHRDAAGMVAVRLATRDGDHGVELWADAATRWLQLFTGDTLEDVATRRKGLAVEPMSCPGDAFNSGVDLITLAPGDEHNFSWGLRAW